MFKYRVFFAIISLTLICSVVLSFSKNVSATTEELPESFENSTIPIGWSSTGEGTLSISDQRSKSGKQALKWAVGNGSKLQVTHLPNRELATGVNGGIKLWLYSEKATPDQYLTFQFGTPEEINANNPRYKFEVNMNFLGWRAVWMRLNNEANNLQNTAELTPTLLEIVPSDGIKDNNIFIDLFHLTSNVHFAYSADYQLPYINNDTHNETYRASLKKPSLPVEMEITAAQKQSFATTMKRLDNYIYGDDINFDSLQEGPVKVRYEALLKRIAERISEYDSFKIYRSEDGTMRGPGLFVGEEVNVTGQALYGNTLDNFEKIWTALVHDYKLNGNEESKQKFFELIDYFHDQGWAEGSGMGTQRSIKLRMSGYVYAIYLMRDELKEAGLLEREMATLRWYSKLGDSFDFRPMDFESLDKVNTDEMRTLVLYNLMYILMMEDTPEKVRYMKGFGEFVTKALAVYSGYSEVLKPGYTGYHHETMYMNAYAPDAIFVGSLIRYVTHGTSFQLDSKTADNIKQFLLVQSSFGNKYDMSHSVSGRFIQPISTLQKQYISYALNGLVGDNELKSIFLNLWDPEDPTIAANFSKSVENSIFYSATIGELQISERAAKQFADEGLEAKNPQTGFQNFNYGSVALYRQNDWLVTTKGFNQYNWDYEQDATNNVFGRYISNGNTEIMLQGGYKASGLDVTNGWDFNRWPGTTTKYFPIRELENSKHRNYSDETFAGGVSSEGEFGVYSMKMHDITYDPTFRANKSWFYFGDQIIALGSNITNNDAKHPTETTLFQSNMNNEILPFYNNSIQPITEYPYNNQPSETNIWLLDPFGNGYIIPNTRNVNIRRSDQLSYSKVANKETNSFDYKETVGKYTTAWIDHGLAPTNGEYEYVILPQKTPQEVEAVAQKLEYEVLQKDNAAHIVKYDNYQSIGYAIFNPPKSFDYGVLHSVDTPVLMIEKLKSADRVVLSLSDPDLRLVKTGKMGSLERTKTESESKTITVKLNGLWSINSNLSVGVELKDYNYETQTTTLTIVVDNGKNYNVYLEKRKLEFQDGFENSNLSNWLNTENAEVQVTKSNRYITVSNNDKIRAKDGDNWADYTLEADVLIKNRQVGLVFRGQSTLNQYYLLDIRNYDNKINLFKMSGGSQVIKSVPYSVELNRLYKLKIDVIGNQFSVFIDGVEVMKGEDTSNNPYTTGTVGIRTPGNQARASIDNVKVTDRQSEEIFFSDDMEQGLDLWTNIDNVIVESEGPDLFELNLANNTSMRANVGSDWKDYALELDLTLLQSETGVVFRSQEDVGYYMLAISEESLKFYKVNEVMELLEETDFKAELNKKYKIRIIIKGTKFTAYIDGTPILEAQDNSYLKGTIGFNVSAHSQALFDNVMVEKIEDYTDATLEDLKINSVTIKDFAKEKYYYSLNVPYTTDLIEVSYTATDSEATVEVSGSKQLIVGNNIIYVKVTTKNGKTETYIIDVHRADGSKFPPSYVPDIEDIETNPLDVYRLPDQLLDNASSNIEVRLDGTERSILITKKQVEKFNGRSLIIQTETSQWEMSSDTIESIINVTPKPDDASIIISLQEKWFNPQSMEKKVEQRHDLNGGQYNNTGQQLILSIAIIDKEGEVNNIKKTLKPFKISFDILEDMNPHLLGVYYVSSNGEIEYRGGKINTKGRRIVAEVDALGEYTVYSFNANFSDISSNHWAFTSIQQLTAKHIVKGTTATTFSPNNKITRAEFAALLVRVLSLTADNKTSTFVDVAPSSWYYDEIAAAQQAGIIQGTQGHFEPSRNISREEMAIMLMKAYNLLDRETENSTPVEISDKQMVSSWAIEYVQSALEVGLLKGRDARVFAPTEKTSRAEAVQAIYNFLKMLE
ncbi:chondroitinase family polysaccharide lyase [Paenibacillus yanchengensis]|uniref:Chondroitinase family polysaccharide lyase n=1 Tax=Paenibacillus yanchengensis TaxID=2035833 RepID=A0ABW4YR39_9BACL